MKNIETAISERSVYLSPHEKRASITTSRSVWVFFYGADGGAIRRIKIQRIQSKGGQRVNNMKTRNLITAGIISAGLTFGVVAQAAHEETQVEMKDVPEAAQTTIKEKAGDDQILRIEKETRKGKELYEAIVSKDGKETAIQVDANGKYLGTHDEKTEHKEKGEKH